MTTLNAQIKSEIQSISNSVFTPIAKANQIAEQLKKTFNKLDFFSLFYRKNLNLQEAYFPYIEFDETSPAFDNIILTAYDHNYKPVEYTFKFHKGTDIQVNYDSFMNQNLTTI